MIATGDRRLHGVYETRQLENLMVEEGPGLVRAPFRRQEGDTVTKDLKLQRIFDLCAFFAQIIALKVISSLRSFYLNVQQPM